MRSFGVHPNGTYAFENGHFYCMSVRHHGAPVIAGGTVERPRHGHRADQSGVAMAPERQCTEELRRQPAVLRRFWGKIACVKGVNIVQLSWLKKLFEKVNLPRTYPKFRNCVSMCHLWRMVLVLWQALVHASIYSSIYTINILSQTSATPSHITYRRLN